MTWPVLAAPLLSLALLGGERVAVLAPSLEETETYSESYTFIADLDDETYVQLQLQFTNLGVGDGHGICRALVAEPRGTAWTAFATFEREEWGYDPSSRSLAVGACTAIEADGSARVEVALKGGRVTLELASPLGALAPPGSQLQVAQRHFDYWVMVPWAGAKVNLELPGRAPRSGSGRGFADHSRSTAMPGQLARRWVRVRALDEHDSLLLLGRYVPDGSRVEGWAWRQGWSAPRPLDELTLTRRDANADERTGWMVRARARDETFSVDAAEQLYRYAPLEEYGALGFVARRLVGNPVTRTYRAELVIGSNAPRRALAEVQHVQ